MNYLNSSLVKISISIIIGVEAKIEAQKKVGMFLLSAVEALSTKFFIRSSS